MKKKLILIIILIVSIICLKIIINNYYVEKWKLSKFDLRNEIPIEIEYQIRATYTSCWAYSALDCIETNIMLHKGILYNFSESHVEYMTSKILGGARDLHGGGDMQNFLDYINEKKGPVLEREIPNKEYKQNEYEQLKKASIFKISIDTVKFSKDDEKMKNKIKKHIVENGSIYATFYFEPPVSKEIDKYYNSETYGYCNMIQNEANHAISIIGWDDNYSKENFPKENRPQKNGAYIVMSFWKEFENDHIIYVSYEDILIESDMIGILNVEVEGEI